MGTLIDRFRLGGMHVAALSDGIGQLWPADWFPGVPDAEWMAAVGATNARAPLTVNFGSFLVRTEGQTVLIDTGNGEGRYEEGEHEGGAGLLDRLAELGVAPADVDLVLLTHFHGDHVGWNVRASGDITFPNATFYLHRADLAHIEVAPSTPRNDFSRSRLLPVRDAGRLEPFEGEHSPVAGVTYLETPGHTPGHCSLLLSSGGERLLIAGDAAPNVAHLEHPEWTPVYDLDGPRAVEARRTLAERAIREDALVTGGHFPILTVGRLERAQHGYRWQSAEVERLPTTAE